MSLGDQWFIGPNSNIFSFLKKHRDIESAGEQTYFSPFISRSSIYLTADECQELHRLTYLNDHFPFGKVDVHTKVGQVSTNSEYCELFNSEIKKSLQIVELVPTLSALLKSVIRCYVPLCAVKNVYQLRKDGSGQSCHWLKGAVFLSLPENHPHSSLEFALNIVHELGHQVLMIYQDADDIVKDLYQPVYSSVRKTERPAIMSYHGLVAVYFMAYFLHSLLQTPNKWTLKEKQYLGNRLETLSRDFIGGVFALKNSELTALGNFQMREMIDFILNIRAAA